MINIVHIETAKGKKPYPFKFGMRLLFEISGKYDLEFDEIYDKMLKDYDICLDVFVLANKLGVKEDGGNKITAKEMEDALDDNMFTGDGKLMQKLLSAFNTEQAEGQGGSKKKKR